MRFAGSAGNGQSYINAALRAGGDLDKTLSASAPNWGTLTGQANKSKAEEQIMGMEAEAAVAGAGLQSLGMTKQAAFESEAIKAGGEAAAAATQAEGLGNMFSGLGGGLVNAFSKGAGKGFGGSTPYAGAFTPGGSLDTFGAGGYTSVTGNNINSFGGNTFGAFQPGASFNVPSRF